MGAGIFAALVFVVIVLSLVFTVVQVPLTGATMFIGGVIMFVVMGLIVAVAGL